MASILETDIIKFSLGDVTIATDGMGYWSSHKADVKHLRATLTWHQPDGSPGFKKRWGMELRVFFNKKSWDTRKNGLIYTDVTWLAGLKTHLMTMGFSATALKKLDYSEQGMQGRDFVSMNADEKFLAECVEKFGK